MIIQAQKRLQSIFLGVTGCQKRSLIGALQTIDKISGLIIFASNTLHTCKHSDFAPADETKVLSDRRSHTLWIFLLVRKAEGSFFSLYEKYAFFNSLKGRSSCPFRLSKNSGRYRRGRRPSTFIRIRRLCRRIELLILLAKSIIPYIFGRPLVAEGASSKKWRRHFQIVDKVFCLTISASCALHACRHKGFRACGRNQRAFRSPFGSLRSPDAMKCS